MDINANNKDGVNKEEDEEKEWLGEGFAEEEKDTEDNLLYGVTDVPSWPVTIIYAVQQAAVTSAGGPLVMAFMVYKAICGDDDVLFAQLVSTTLFMCGICTIVQILFGIRLPIKQGSSWTFIGPIMAMMATEQWKCPQVIPNTGNETLFSWDNGNLSDSTVPLWQPRLMHISGGIVLASIVQAFLGATGLVGLLMNFIGPLTVIPTVSLIGLSLYHGMIDAAATHWGISGLSMGLFLLFTLFLENIQVPYITWNRAKKWHTDRYPVFKVFPSVLAMIISWVICLILTETGVFTSDKTDPGYQARTDARADVIEKMSWFYFPYPGQWGMPTFGPAIFIGTLAATLSSIVESIGTYHVLAAVCQVKCPPKHAINRGIAMEGLLNGLCGVMGMGLATTGLASVAGLVSLTGMGSRLVWIMFGVMLVIFGLIGKVGAILSTVPDPVLAGITIPALGMVTSVAFLNLRHVNMKKSRNLMILGLSHLLGIAIPDYLKQHPDAINTGIPDLDQTLMIFLSTSIFLGGFIGFTLDNLVPGSKEDRGVVSFNAFMFNDSKDETADPYELYRLPPVFRFLERLSCSPYMPVCPPYKPRDIKCCNRRKDDTKYEESKNTEKDDEV